MKDGVSQIFQSVVECLHRFWVGKSLSCGCVCVWFLTVVYRLQEAKVSDRDHWDSVVIFLLGDDNGFIMDENR